MGRLLIPAAQRVLPGGEAVGLDIQRGMVERLKARAEQMGIANLTAMLGDAMQPIFPAESFDVIYLCGVLGEIPDPKGVLGQCHAALKPEGMLSITEIFADPDYQSRPAVQRLAEASGFRLREAFGPWYYFTANFVKPAGVRTRPQGRDPGGGRSQRRGQFPALFAPSVSVKTQSRRESHSSPSSVPELAHREA